MLNNSRPTSFQGKGGCLGASLAVVILKNLCLLSDNTFGNVSDVNKKEMNIGGSALLLTFSSPEV